MTDGEEAEEKGDGEGGAPPGERAGWRLPGPLDLSASTLLLVGVAVLLIGVAAVATFQLRDLRGEDDEREEVAEVASQFTTALVAYDHEDITGSLERVLDLSTPEYGDTYEEAFSAELQPVIGQLEARGEVFVRDVFIGEISDDQAAVVVLFDATIESTLGVRRLTGSYVQIELTKVEGEWRARDPVFLATAEEGLEPAGEATSPTTTAPAGASPTTTAPAAGAPATTAGG